ncbi:hypothetical protein PR048_016489 [Dryococelus australis]|uniref:Uncharacterized protein n=1 Tax=Dryococelus australis TaxID=614101 RepID=A0ABQ9HK54_9NEOP|nr:hypothetical protein PR048_016489 [Dryococelus australis]
MEESRGQHEGLCPCGRLTIIPISISKKTPATNFSIFLEKTYLNVSDDWLWVTWLIGTEILAEHSRHCNYHAHIVENIQAPAKNGNPPVLKFQSYHKIDKVPIVVYVDFETMLVLVQTCSLIHILHIIPIGANILCHKAIAYTSRRITISSWFSRPSTSPLI